MYRVAAWNRRGIKSLRFGCNGAEISDHEGSRMHNTSSCRNDRNVNMAGLVNEFMDVLFYSGPDLCSALVVF